MRQTRRKYVYNHLSKYMYIYICVSEDQTNDPSSYFFLPWSFSIIDERSRFLFAEEARDTHPDVSLRYILPIDVLKSPHELYSRQVGSVYTPSKFHQGVAIILRLSILENILKNNSSRRHCSFRNIKNSFKNIQTSNSCSFE